MTFVAMPVGLAVRANAHAQGMSLNEYIAGVVATHLDLPQYAPPPPPTPRLVDQPAPPRRVVIHWNGLDPLSTKMAMPLGQVVRSNAETLGIPCGRYIAHVLSMQLGMPQHAPQLPTTATEQELPLKTA